MATTTTWTGAVDGDWDTSGNWSNGVPNTDSTAIIDGSESITGGSPASDQVERVYVASTYTGAIGSSGTPLELDVAQLSHSSTSASATSYVDLTGSANQTPDVLIDGTFLSTPLVLSGVLNKVIIASGFLGTLLLGNGASFKSEITNLYMLAGTVDASTAGNMDWQQGGEIVIRGGTLLLGDNIGEDGTLTMSDGTVTVSGWTEEDGDTFNIMGGTVSWNSGALLYTSQLANTVKTINVYGGTFTLAGNSQAYVALTDITQYGGTVNLESGFANIEIIGDYDRFAGAYTPPKQSVVTTAAL